MGVAAEMQLAGRIGREIVRHITIAAKDDRVVPCAELRIAGL